MLPIRWLPYILLESSHHTLTHHTIRIHPTLSWGPRNSTALSYGGPMTCLIPDSTFSQGLRNLWDTLILLLYQDSESYGNCPGSPRWQNKDPNPSLPDSQNLPTLPCERSEILAALWMDHTLSTPPASWRFLFPLPSLPSPFLCRLDDCDPSPKIWFNYHPGWNSETLQTEKDRNKTGRREPRESSFSHLSLLVYKTGLTTHNLPNTWSFGEDQMGLCIWNHFANYQAPYKYKLLLIVILIK